MQVFVLERVIPPLVITFKLAVDSVSSNHIFALFLFLFNSHYLKKSVHGPGPKPFYKNKKVSMDLVHDRLRVVPHFSPGIRERAKRERPWKSSDPAPREKRRHGDFHARSSFARSTIAEEKWGTTRSLGPWQGSMEPVQSGGTCFVLWIQSNHRIEFSINLGFPIAHLPAGRLIRLIRGKFLWWIRHPAGSWMAAAKIFPPIHTSGMSLSSEANHSSDRLYMCSL